MSGELRPANARDRVAATGVDLLLVLLLASLTLLVAGDAVPEVRLAAVVAAIGLPTFVVEAMLGRSVGKLGMQLHHAPPRVDSHALTVPQAAGRFVVKWVVPALLAIAGIWLAAVVWWVLDAAPAFVGERRTIHDRLTGTRVLGRPASTRSRAEGA